MEAITYLNVFESSKRDGQKLAKISQEKMRALSGKYHTFLKTLVVPVEEKKVEVPVTPVVNTMPQEPVVAPVAPAVAMPSDNYKEIIDAFALTVYDKSFSEKPLTGARKIRVNQKVVKHAVGLANKFGKDKLIDVTPNINNTFTSQGAGVSNIVEYPKTQPPIVETVRNVELPQTSNVAEFSRSQEPVVTESVSREALSPSVDDYLQKDVPNQENGIIIQLTGDVEGLKEETVKRAALLEKLEAQYNAIKDQKARRIKELEEEKLSYTATLEGLTERIRNLQAAIEKEEQSLSGYKKAA